MLNLLTEPLIHFNHSDGGRRKASLTQVYAALMSDEVESFPALRPHQRHAWHAFLVQLGAMAIHRAGEDSPPETAEEWHRIIRSLTSDDEPWELVVDDFKKPAFMQPPAGSAGKLADYKSRVDTPDELDMLVTSKNHDLKAAVAMTPGADDWLFSLVALQTMEGFGGAGNYGVSRMNGGLGSRSAFTLSPSIRMGAHVRRDIKTLLQRRPGLLEDHPMADRGIGLLWTVRLGWDCQEEALSIPKLEPLYIEVCRRIRLLHNPNGRICAVRTSSKAARIESKASNGLTGDPWTLVDKRDKKGHKSLTLPAGGFTYKRITDYLNSADWDLPTLFAPTSAEGHSLVARSMVRGQGKTEGYHERIIPLRPGVVGGAMLGRNIGSRGLDVIAKERVDDVGKVQRILSHAIQVFIARGDSGKISPEHRNLARPWLNRLDEAIDADFFEDLQDEVEAEETGRKGFRNQWLLNGKNGVIDNARALLYDATDSLPCPSIHRYKARTNAEGLFEGRLRGNNGFPDLFP